MKTCKQRNNYSERIVCWLLESPTGIGIVLGFAIIGIGTTGFLFAGILRAVL